MSSSESSFYSISTYHTLSHSWIWLTGWFFIHPLMLHWWCGVSCVWLSRGVLWYSGVINYTFSSNYNYYCSSFYSLTIAISSYLFFHSAACASEARTDGQKSQGPRVFSFCNPRLNQHLSTSNYSPDSPPPGLNGSSSPGSLQLN